MAATSTLTTFNPPQGLPPRDALVHAKEHIEKLQKKHESLKSLKSETEAIAKKHMSALSETLFVTSAAGVMGYVNGRYGGEKGYVAAIRGVPLDLCLGVAAHGIGFSNVLGDEVSSALHAVGDAAVAVSAYRYTHKKGTEQAHASDAAAAASAAPRTVYTAAPNGAAR